LLVYEAFKAYIFDLDGVIYRGDELQLGAAETIQTLRSRGDKVHFLTNNSTQSRQQYADKLTRLGVSADPEDVMTSAYATALYLREKTPGECRAYVVGESGLREELESVGVEVVDELDGRPIHFVVAGLDREFSYRKLFNAQQAILRGAEFVATNCDPTFPLEEGLISPGGGTMVAAIQTATAVAPRVIGKPETYSLEKVMALVGATTEETLIIGDRLDTDILVGRKAGVHTALVLTGVTTEEEARNAPEEMKPDWIIRTLAELDR
jgi:4-nitrophenyl phosphatase